MNLPILIASLIFISAIFQPVVGIAKVLPISLKEMTNEADWIIIGSIKEIKKTDVKHDEYGYELLVKISVEEIIKGETAKSVEVQLFQDLSTEPEVSLNERAIFFIKSWKGRNVIVQGYAGKVSIDNEHVKIISIKDEAPTQNFQKFVNKIKKFVGMDEKKKGKNIKRKHGKDFLGTVMN